MRRIDVESSSLRSIGYLDAQRVLEVEFRTGAVYRYWNVPPDVHAALLAAPSHGAHFNQNIRNRYPHERAA